MSSPSSTVASTAKSPDAKSTQDGPQLQVAVSYACLEPFSGWIDDNSAVADRPQFSQVPHQGFCQTHGLW